MTPPAKKTTSPTLKDMLNNEENPSSTAPEVVTTPSFDNGPFLSDNVVATVPNKTPAELAAESPEETAARYNINTTITEEDAENPRVQVYDKTRVDQVPSGTHLHPDIAKSSQNRGIAEMHTDNALVRHQDAAPSYDFAPDADYNDKFQKPVEVEDPETIEEQEDNKE